MYWFCIYNMKHEMHLTLIVTVSSGNNNFIFDFFSSLFLFLDNFFYFFMRWTNFFHFNPDSLTESLWFILLLRGFTWAIHKWTIALLMLPASWPLSLSLCCWLYNRIKSKTGKNKSKKIKLWELLFKIQLFNHSIVESVRCFALYICNITSQESLFMRINK